MYTYTSNVSYPLVDVAKLGGSSTMQGAVKQVLVDFRISIYSDSIVVTPTVDLTSFILTTGGVNLTLLVKAPAAVATITLQTSITAQGFTRVHFDTSDCIFTAPSTDLNTQVEGFICFTTSAEALTALEGSLFEPTSCPFEPTTVSVFSKHRVHSIKCRNKKPLITQTVASKYTVDSEPILGAVKLVAGSNCSISLQPRTNTIILTAQQLARSSQEEVCGVWRDKVPDSKDTLCNEVIYTISGAEPDANGNLKLLAQAPLSVSSLKREQLPDRFDNITSNAQFASIIRFIYIGLPQTDNNASVFDCTGV